MDQLEKVGKKLLGSQIEDSLMEYILNEPVAIGEKLPNEFELAEKFGVGRSTIREAVKSLVSKGVLEVGRFEDKYHLALELFEVRLMLEPEIAALASEYASEEEKAQLESLCDQVERQYTAGINHIKKDIEFHTCIAKCSRNRVVEILIPLINSSVSTFATLTRRQLMKETIETHRAVTNAILKGDSVGARCAMIMHLTYNRQKLLELLEAQEKDWEGRKEGE